LVPKHRNVASDNLHLRLAQQNPQLAAIIGTMNFRVEPDIANHFRKPRFAYVKKPKDASTLSYRHKMEVTSAAPGRSTARISASWKSASTNSRHPGVNWSRVRDNS
jgi:hypothetical protein